MDNATLQRFKSKEVSGIPGFRLNQPFAPRTMVGDIGLELELEGQRLVAPELITNLKLKSRSQWIGHTDGSLRGESLEYVLSVPCFEDELQPLVFGLWDAFRQNRTVLANSNRCSTHCHVNIQGLKISDLVAIFSLWAVFEKQIIEKFGGESRTSNHFCLSLRESVENVSVLRSLLKFGNLPQGDHLKYAALNISPISNRGSFEFRCGPASDTPEIPLMYGTFLKKFRDFAVRHFHNPSVLGNVLSERGPVELFKDICDESPILSDFYRIVVPQGTEHEFNRVGVEGFRIAQPLCHIFPWNDWMEEIDKRDIDPFAQEQRPKSRNWRPNPPRPRDFLNQDENVARAMARDQLQPLLNIAAEVAAQHVAAVQLEELVPGRRGRPAAHQIDDWDIIPDQGQDQDQEG